jgi:transcription termination factor Rho
MPVLERSDLEASPLSDLHAIADQLGLDGFRRLRKAALIDAILGEGEPAADDGAEPEGVSPDPAPERDLERPEASRTRRRAPRSPIGRLRRGASPAREGSAAEDAEAMDEPEAIPAPAAVARERGTAGRDRDGDDALAPDDGRDRAAEGGRDRKADGGRSRTAEDRGDRKAAVGGPTAEGVVEVLSNGSAFLRIAPPEPSDEDVYISAAQVRRCELVSGDRVSGPVRTPRRSERYSSLVRIDTINGAPADTVSDGARYDDLAVAYPTERLALGSEDPTLEAIEFLTPLGKGSRAVIVGAPRAGKTETLRRMLAAVAGRDDLDVSVVLAGSRPEEIVHWQEGPVQPVAALNFAASADSQGQVVERAVESAKRVAARGGNALVLIDGLDGLHPHAARKVLAAARKLRDGGSLTVVATAARPFGGETTVIALDVALTSTGRQPILDLLNSGALRPELLVGDDGAQAITQARAAALEEAG